MTFKRTQTAAERLLNLSVPEPNSGCWLWLGSIRSGTKKFARPYGRIIYWGNYVLAHRLAWQEFNGEIPEGLLVCHRCDNTLCVNPSHLFLGTHADNAADMLAKGRERRGDSHKNTKIPDKEIPRLLDLRRAGATLKELAGIFGVHFRKFTTSSPDSRDGPRRDAMPEIIKSMPSEQYHQIKALSASMAITLVERCALVAFTESAFNPDLAPENKKEFDIGKGLHLAVLEPERFADRTVCHGFDSYRSKDAQEARDAAYDAGQTPLKPAEADLVLALRDSIHNTPEIARLLAQPGDAEVTLTWEWDGLPMKCRPDFLAADGSFVIDLKSSVSAEPRQVSRKAFTDGWHVRSAFYMAGVAAVTGKLPERYWFACVEKDRPYIAQLYEMDERALIWGEQIIGRAIHLFRECRESGWWPKYRQGPSIISLPTWAEYGYSDREAAGEFSGRPTPAQVERGNDFLKP